MNNTLTAKEWLNDKNCRETGDKTLWINRMNAYASYRTKELEEKIMEYRKYLKQEEDNYGLNRSFAHYEISEAIYYLMQEFDKHFNITSETKEK